MEREPHPQLYIARVIAVWVMNPNVELRAELNALVRPLLHRIVDAVC